MVVFSSFILFYFFLFAHFNESDTLVDFQHIPPSMSVTVAHQGPITAVGVYRGLTSSTRLTIPDWSVTKRGRRHSFLRPWGFWGFPSQTSPGQTMYVHARLSTESAVFFFLFSGTSAKDQLFGPPVGFDFDSGNEWQVNRERMMDTGLRPKSQYRLSHQSHDKSTNPHSRIKLCS